MTATSAETEPIEETMETTSQPSFLVKGLSAVFTATGDGLKAVGNGVGMVGKAVVVTPVMAVGSATTFTVDYVTGAGFEKKAAQKEAAATTIQAVERGKQGRRKARETQAKRRSLVGRSKEGLRMIRGSLKTAFDKTASVTSEVEGRIEGRLKTAGSGIQDRLETAGKTLKDTVEVIDGTKSRKEATAATKLQSSFRGKQVRAEVAEKKRSKGFLAQTGRFFGSFSRSVYSPVKVVGDLMATKETEEGEKELIAEVDEPMTPTKE